MSIPDFQLLMRPVLEGAAGPQTPRGLCSFHPDEGPRDGLPMASKPGGTDHPPEALPLGRVGSSSPILSNTRGKRRSLVEQRPAVSPRLHLL
jgi:hypothetical protein